MRTDEHSDNVICHPTNDAVSLLCRGIEASIVEAAVILLYGLHLKCNTEPGCYSSTFPEVSHSSKNATFLKWWFPEEFVLVKKRGSKAIL